YQAVSEIIGISAQKDDAEAYTIRSLKGYMPAAKPDRNHQKMYAQYVSRKAYFESAGSTLGRVPLALLTKDRGNRKAYAYNDTDFYADHNMSAWRPWMLVDELKKNRNFTYTGGKLAVGFSEKKAYAEL